MHPLGVVLDLQSTTGSIANADGCQGGATEDGTCWSAASDLGYCGSISQDPACRTLRATWLVLAIELQQSGGTTRRPQVPAAGPSALLSIGCSDAPCHLPLPDEGTWVLVGPEDALTAFPTFSAVVAGNTMTIDATGKDGATWHVVYTMKEAG
jgi:hypothetical protein